MYSALGAEEFLRRDEFATHNERQTHEGYDENPSTDRQRSLLILKSSNATSSKHFARRNVDNSLSRKRISRRSLKLLIPDNFRDNCLLIYHKDRVTIRRR